MTQPVERLVNLAIYLASTPVPVSAEQVRASVDGYPASQDQDAFLRMFERDKEHLRDAGLVIVSDEDSYRIDSRASFATPVVLAPEEVAAVRAVGLAFLDDPAFPFAEDLRLALAKVATAVDEPDLAVWSCLADEAPTEQADAVARLDTAISSRKRVHFRYTNSYGEHKQHHVEPYGLFTRDGRWYLVGRDTARDETRVYAVARLEDLEVNPAKPKSADYEPPADFDVARFIGLPFQYGEAPFEAVLRFDAEAGWRAAALSSGEGELATADDGAVLWRVEARSLRRLIQWVLENGPGIGIEAPASAADVMRRGLLEVVASHG